MTFVSVTVHACVCACVGACVCLCLCVWMCLCGSVGVHKLVCVFVRVVGSMDVRQGAFLGLEVWVRSCVFVNVCMGACVGVCAPVYMSVYKHACVRFIK